MASVETLGGKEILIFMIKVFFFRLNVQSSNLIYFKENSMK